MPTTDTIRVFGSPVFPEAVAQLRTCMADERAVAGALMADHHVGYSMPIGGVVAYQDAISPSGVGFDIACGNMAVRTAMPAAGVEVAEAVAEINRRVAFGMGRSNPTPIEHQLFEPTELWRELERLYGGDLRQAAQAQLGTVGAGNHYVDLLVDEDGLLWVANHFGSRGLGHRIASGFLNLADGRPFKGNAPDKAEPTVYDLDTETGVLYLEAMRLAGEYAYAGREYVIGQALEVLGNPAVTLSVHNHHNFAWLEDGLWVVRKGATPLTHEPAFIGGSMGDVSVIVRGTGEELGHLGSAPHGAGRVMSRTKARGKFRRRKRWECGDRNCDWTTPTLAQSGSTRCPDHPDARLLKRWSEERVSEGVIDWPAVKADLAERGIVVVGADADEAPAVYKSLAAVLAAHPNIEILHRLQPVGVVMAGADVFDPWKD